MSLVFSALGLLVLVYRLGWRRSPLVSAPDDGPLVSIVVPARNEERNLATLVPSLLALSYANKEIIVVNDESSDKTSEVAKSFGVQVIEAGLRPAGYVGKNWACARGAEIALGRYLLFTDADTVHDETSLSRAMAHSSSKNAGLLTAPPFHLTPTSWEKLSGLFQLLPLILTAFRQPPSSSRNYSIGQYLLFERTCYDAIGGHRALRSSLTEDIDLGRAVLARGRELVVHEDATLYSVRMFASYPEFFRGWIRLLRVGMSKSNVVSVFELLLVIQLFIGPNSAAGAALKVTAVLFLIYRQRHFGEFSFLGPILFPYSLLMFTVMSGTAVVERFIGEPVRWRGRDYA